MNVLVLNKFFRRSGGAETVVFDTIELLETAGHSVAVFAMDDPRNEASDWHRHFAPVRDYYARGLASRVRDATASIYSFEARKRLRALLREYRPHVAHLHNVYHQLTMSVVDELHAAGVPMVMTVHDYKPICPNYRLLADDGVCTRCVGGSVRHAVVHRCVLSSRTASAVAALELALARRRRSYEKIDRLIAPSEFLADMLVRGGLSRGRIDVIPNSTAVDRATGGPTSPTFVYFGRIVEEKGLRVLVAATELLVGQEFEVVVYGTGPLLEELRGYSGYHGLPIEFRGFGSRDDIARTLMSSRAAVLPSLWYENCPTSILEACAAGVPSIASRIGGVPELVDNGRTGLLVTPGSPEALAEAMAELIASPAVASALGTAARAQALERHSPEAYLGRLLDTYSRACGGLPEPDPAGAATG